MTDEEYIRSMKIVKLHQKLIFLQMNESKIGPELFEERKADIQSQINKLKIEGEK